MASGTTAHVDRLTQEQLDLLCINTIRTLAMDAVQKANSGHPGTPMALALLPMSFQINSSGIILATPNGPTEIDSCFHAGTHRSCNM